MGTASGNHPNVPNRRQALINAIEAHIAREKLTRTGFGRDAVDDASFLGHLGRGSDVRLETADKVLAFLGEELIGPRFMREIDAWLRVTRAKPHLLGRQALGDPSFVLRLERGRSPTLGTVDRVGAWMVDNASATELEAAHAAVEDGSPAVPVDGAREEELEMATDYMTTRQVAAYLGLSPRTLESYRCRGGGPPFYVFGSVVRYLLSDVVKWASKRRRNSTSDDGLRSPIPKDEDKKNDGDDEDDGADGPGSVLR